MILLTGANGFVGTHFTAGSGQACHALASDLLDPGAVAAEIRAMAPPSAVLHLAGLSSVAQSFGDPDTTYAVNFQGTRDLLRSLADAGFSGRFVFVSSGDVYGRVPESELPVTEDRAPHPRNPYGCSKLAAEAACLEYAHGGPFEVVILRPFNHVGPGQSPDFAISGFARRLALVAAGRADSAILEVGNLDVTRDFTDVRDVVAAYRSVLACPSIESGTVLNVCSGVEYRLSDLVTELRGIDNLDIEIRVDPARLRANEQQRMCGDAGRLRTLTGWQPRGKLSHALRDIYDYWKQRAQQE